jgi:hypothetical protein
MKASHWILGVVLATAGIAVADPDMTLVDGTARFYTDQPMSETDPYNLSDFVVHSNGTDQLYGNWWYYRAEGQTREYAFAGGTFTSSGNVGQYTATAVAHGTPSEPGLGIQIDYELFSVNALEAYVREVVTLTNLAEYSNVRLALFNYVDFDLNDTVVDDAAVMITPQLIEQYRGPIIAKFEGIVADAWEIDEFSQQLQRFGDANVDNLSNSNLAGPGERDYTSAFQWDIELSESGGTATFEEILTVTVPEPATLTLLLLGGLTAIRRR